METMKMESRINCGLVIIITLQTWTFVNGEFSHTATEYRNSNEGLTTFPLITGKASLTHVYVETNAITSIPAGELVGFDVIKFLSLSGNSLSEFPDVIDMGDTLETLFLEHNAIAVINNDIASLIKLKFLRLYGNRLTSVYTSIWGVGAAGCWVYLFDNPIMSVEAPITTMDKVVWFKYDQLASIRACQLARLAEEKTESMVGCWLTCNITGLLAQAKADCLGYKTGIRHEYEREPPPVPKLGHVKPARNPIDCARQCISKPTCSGIFYSKTDACALFDDNAPNLNNPEEWDTFYRLHISTR